ncbi:protein windpipe [Drosophila novamexicana]|uniref:protein windpipe n=1 Tax=Drosophila novamexicana TaxID=47314 RepID=UPI0011E5FAE0|nr:protein windpipe [Drosophila novamexicana]XP_030559962.1 protein windpipe [Drosophila novamexicana]
MERRINLLPALLALLLCICTAAAAAAVAETPAYYCPEDCSCSLSQHTHKPLLHAKCNSTKGLKLSEQPLRAGVPIHSIDLSYLGLTRVGHVLDMLPNLTSVDLSHNELHELGHLSKRIKKLNLKHNRLTSAKLVKLPQHLQVLNLQHNDITSLPMELTHLQHLQQLELGHNAINCSCSTLEVRNWLQERHVYMEKPVICSQPTEAHGKPWLQLKQSEVCEKEQRGWYASDIDENELMMGDQPVPDSIEQEDEEQELGKDYLVIDGKKSVKAPEPPPLPVQSEVEGSGDLNEMNMELVAHQASEPVPVIAEEPKTEQLVAHDEEDTDEEGSGSGGGALIIPAIHSDPINTDDFEPPESPGSEQVSNENDDDDSYDNKPLEQPATPSADIFKNIGIFEDASGNPVSEEVIVPVVQTKLDVDAPTDVVTDGPLDLDKTSEDILSAKIGKKDDSNAIYFLLGVIALIVLGLILFVAIKRCKYNNNAAARDAEAQRQTELLDMDKTNLGKPLARNGHEHSPLIGEKTKLDEAQIVNGNGKKPYDSKDGAGQQPLLNGNGTANGDAKEVPTINEPVAAGADPAAPHEYYPITPRYPTPQSPRASKYAQHPQGQASGEQNNNNSNNNNNNNNNEPDGAYLPSSPKSGRYSPVYSPETGRVKIKLTETPKPKTPMLVTRSKSNAGDIITTPYLEPTHQVNGIAGH